VEGTEGRRTVVFRKGGVIRLKAGIRISRGNGNVTIAGQTAPGGGIGLARIDDDPASNPNHNLLRIEGDNVILRYVRLRPGFFGGARGPCRNCETKATALGIRNGAKHVIVDHASMSWGNDGSVDLEGGTVNGLPDGTPAWVRNVTIQWSIVSEGITLDPAYDPTQGLTAYQRVDRVSLHHNLFAHNQIRNPEITSGTWQVINNVLYDTPGAVTELYDDEAIQIDYIGNYAAQPGNALFGPMQLRVFKWVAEGSPPGVSLFLDGNIGPSRPNDGELDERLLQCRVRPCPGCLLSLCDEPYPRPWLRPAAQAPSAPTQAPVTIDFNPAYPELWSRGLRDEVGATLPQRDRVDACVVGHIDTGRGSVIRNLSQGCAAGGWSLAEGQAVVDSDADGIPDAYEALHSAILDRFDAADGSQDFDGDCYTNLEEYLNGTSPRVRDPRAREAQPFLGIAAEDGQLLEARAGADVGGTAVAATARVRVGDDSADAERRAVFSFDTSSLPDGATICEATFTLWPVKPVGQPAGLGPIYLVAPPPRTGGLGGEVGLYPSDFEASSKAPSPSWVLARQGEAFEAAVRPSYVDAAGRTQLRLQVADDDGDGIEDTQVFHSSEAAEPALRPVLRVVYQP